MIKIISNKYFLFTLFFLYNCIAFAHDCSSPGDCEETAGYNAALAITGGVIALGAGLISTWMPPDVPDVPENDFESEFGEAFDDEFDDEFSDELDEGNEDKFDEDEFDNDDEDGFEDDDEDEFDEDDDDEDEEFDDTIVSDNAKDDASKSNMPEEQENKEGNSDKDSVLLNETQKIMDTSNNIKTAFQGIGSAGVKLWHGILKGEEYAKAGVKYKSIIDSLKSKGLNNLANKYGVKLMNLLKDKADKLAALKTKGAKTFFKNLDKIKSLGHLADGLTFLNNLNKKTGSGHADWDVTLGAMGEESARIIFKTIVTKNPVVEVGDAVISLAGGPNLDYVVDKTIDNYKKGVTKITEWVYSDHKSANVKLNSDFDFQKKRVEKMNLSPLEKRKKLRKIWGILKKSHGL